MCIRNKKNNSTVLDVNLYNSFSNNHLCILNNVLTHKQPTEVFIG